MKCADATHLVSPSLKVETRVRLPLGLLGFEPIKEYVLLADPEEAPFLWLQVVDNPALAFLVLSPFEFLPTYAPDLAGEDTEFLGLKSPEDARALAIVTLRGPQEATVNLKGPIIINRHNGLAKQVVPVNAAEYAVQHPLPVAL